MASKKYIKTIDKTKNFIDSGIWKMDTNAFGRIKSAFIKNIKIVIITVKNFGKQNLGLQAVALSFFSIMSFVPFLAVIFAISNKLGLGKYLRGLIYDNFENDLIVDKVLSFADNIIKISQQGPYGLISFLVFVWLIIWLMICVERAFNKIWKVKPRKTWKRILTYLSVMVVSPLIITALLSVSLTITNGLNTIGLEISFFKSVSRFMIWSIFYVFVVLMFTAAYMAIPATKVKFLPAFKAAIISALAFTIIQYLYLETQLFVSRLNAVYGVFAAVPLLMVWINIGWFVLLIGSEISYAFQHVDTYPLEELS